MGTFTFSIAETIAKLYGGIRSIVGQDTLPSLPTLALEGRPQSKLL